jgi:hypothetical protein
MFLSHLAAVANNNRVGNLLPLTAVIHFTGTPKPWSVVLPPNADLADDSDAEAWGLAQGAALGNWAMHTVRSRRLRLRRRGMCRPAHTQCDAMLVGFG